MHYYGGKARLGKKIAALIEEYRKPGQEYLEPFCGSLSVTQYVTGKRTASDINGYLITTFKASQQGWVPPAWITQDEYKQLRAANDINDPLTGYAGIVFSYGGAWYNGYTGIPKRAAGQVRTLARRIAACKDVTFLHCPYEQYAPTDKLVYCDPPYSGTNGYHASNFKFDHGKFWDTMRKWSETNTVLVSEYSAPSDFKCIAEFPTHMKMSQNRTYNKRIDKVFTLNESPSLFRWR